MFFLPLVSTAQIRGTVWLDADANGLMTEGEQPIAGIRVKAFDARRQVVAETFSDANGVYTLPVKEGTRVLVRFSELQAGLHPAGKASLTSFVTSPASLALPVYHPASYVGARPRAVQVLYVNGDYSSPSADSLATLVSLPARGTGKAVPLARPSETGALWGLGYDRMGMRLFTSAVARRHSAFGPLGSGGIYRVEEGRSPEAFVKLEQYGIATSPRAFSRDLSGDLTHFSHDSLFFDQVGKMSLGGLDVSDDGKALFVMNLYDRTLYRIGLTQTGHGTATALQLPDPGCKGGTARPWAVKYREGNVYVGMVCDAETSGDPRDLSAHVYALHPESGRAERVLSLPLDYGRGELDYQVSAWQPWTADYHKTFVRSDPSWMIYPQPILADLEFDTDGSLILGLMDRLGHQGGDGMLYQMKGNPTLFQSRVLSGGDILRASLINGKYQLEQNGRAGDRESSGKNNKQGPGGGEFYVGDAFEADGRIWHKEAGIGGLALLPEGQLLVSMREAEKGAYVSGGIRWLSNATGEMLKGFSTIGSGIKSGYSGKNNNVGDVELIGSLPGNALGGRAWLDANANGMQEADETPLAGLTVQIFRGSQKIEETKTDADGRYYFTGLASALAYEIRVALHAGLRQLTAAGRGADRDIDSDAVTEKEEAVIRVTTRKPGESMNDYSFGFICNEVPQLTLRLQCPRGGRTASLVADGADERLRVDWNEGTAYKGSVMYADARVVPAGGLLLQTTDPAAEGYTVRAFNAGGCFKDYRISAQDVAACRQSLGGDQVTEGLSVSPNPTSGMAHVVYRRHEAEGDATLEISTADGRLLQQQMLKNQSGVYETTLDLSGKPAGNYLVSIRVNGRSETRQLVKR